MCLTNWVSAQYFGKNKVKYEDFDFKIYNTPHFEIYHYLQHQENLNRVKNKHTPIFSTGLGARINLFGYAIVEPYVAIPWQMEDRSPQFGLFLSAGGW